jgi:hypothetical protein
MEGDIVETPQSVITVLSVTTAVGASPTSPQPNRPSHEPSIIPSGRPENPCIPGLIGFPALCMGQGARGIDSRSSRPDQALTGTAPLPTRGWRRGILTRKASLRPTQERSRSDTATLRSGDEQLLPRKERFLPRTAWFLPCEARHRPAHERLLPGKARPRSAPQRFLPRKARCRGAPESLLGDPARCLSAHERSLSADARHRSAQERLRRGQERRLNASARPAVLTGRRLSRKGSSRPEQGGSLLLKYRR